MCTNYTIIGGGVIGLTIAYELLKRNKTVTIFNVTESTTASLAAGGMLGGQNEFSAPSPLFELALESCERHRLLAKELFKLTAIDIEFIASGLLKIAACTQDNRALLQQLHFLQQANTTSVTWQPAQQIEPLLNTAIGNGMHIATDHQVRATSLVRALTKAVTQLGATFVHERVITIKDKTIQTTHATHSYKKIIVTAGAWTNQLLPQLPMYAVKGECLLLRSPTMPATTIFSTDGCYIVPKRNNEILIGATSYANDMTSNVTAGGVQSLLTRSIAIMPMLANASLISTWCGVRPQTIDQSPIIGHITNDIYVCTGHYRNGILLSAITGELVANALLGDAMSIRKLRPFSPQRFNKGEDCIEANY